MPAEHDWIAEGTLELTEGAPPAVAIDGDTAIVGVTRTYADADTGYAAIVEHGTDGWRVVQMLRPAEPRAWQLFGGDVAISGDLTVVGATSCGSDELRPGEAFVFHRERGVWMEQARLRAGDAAPGDCFATSVAIAGNTIAVAGRAGTYLFECTADAWSEVGRLAGAGPISFAGDRMLVGSEFGVDTEARVHERADGRWLPSAALHPSNAGDNRFGYSVALSGPVAVVGAPTFPVSSQGIPRCQVGAAYVFRDAGGSWTEEGRLDGGAPIACFGTSSAASDSIVAVGGTMRAVAYTRGASGWSLEKTWTYAGTSYAANVEVALSGDVLVTAWPYVSPTAGPLSTSVSFYRAIPR